MMRRRARTGGTMRRGGGLRRWAARTALRVAQVLPVVGGMVRGYQRQMQRLVDVRSYLAAQVNRLTDGLHAAARLSTQDQEFSRDGGRLQAVARQVVRNMDAAATAVDKGASRVYGWKGVWPQVRTGTPALDAEIEKEFKRDARRLGVRGESFRALQRVLMRELVTVGEAYAYHGVLDGRFVVGTFESEQLAGFASGQAQANEGEIIANGIRYDRWGRALGYLVLEALPGSWGTGLGTVSWREIPAGQVCHLFLEDRPTQWRGVAPFDATLMGLNDIGETDFAELTGMKMGACAGLVIEDADGDALDDWGAEDETDPETGDARREIRFAPGAVNVISGKVHHVDPTRPGNQYLPYIMNRLKRIAARFGLTYHEISGDTSQANYSSMQADRMSQQGATEDRQVALTELVLVPLFREWLTWAVLQGRVRLRRYTVDEVMDSLEWQYPGVPPVNPKDAASADILEIGAGLKTWSQAVSERGNDPRETAAALQAEDKMLQEYGLSRAMLLAQAGVLGAFAQSSQGSQDGQGNGGAGSGNGANSGSGKAAKVIGI